MATVVSSGQLTLTDLNDAIIASTQPSSPSDGTLWIDSSVTPNLLKKYSTASLSWSIIGEISTQGTGTTVTSNNTTLGNMVDDSLIDVTERQVVKDKLTEILGFPIYNGTTTLPTTTSLDSGSTTDDSVTVSTKGSFYTSRKSATNAGLGTSDANYTNLATQYNSLKTYLEGLTPVDVWDVSSTNKSSNVSVNKDTWRTNWQNYYLAEQALDTATANQLKGNVDGVTVGGKNLILSSDTAITTTSYLISSYTLSENIITGQQYTFVINGTVPSGQKFGIWENNGSSNVGYATTQYSKATNTTYVTFTAVATTTGNEKSLNLYNYPSGTTTATVNWVALYKGNKPMDWTPAPEDKVSKSNVIFSINNTTETIKIQATHIDISGSVTFSDLDTSTQTTINNKTNTFTAQPTIPYKVGDIWKNGSTTYICTVARSSGSFTSGDWSLTGDVTSSNTSYDTSRVNGVASNTISGAVTNFNNNNDRMSDVPATPTAPTTSSVINTDGSADVTFSWTFSGTGNTYNVDGFIVEVYSATANTAYTIVDNATAQDEYITNPTNRSIVVRGIPANKFYTFGVRAYRMVDSDINSAGIIKGSFVQNTTPYQPSSTVKFTGSINNTSASTVESNASNGNTAYGSTSNWQMTGKTTIDGGKIEADTITATQISVASLSAISANLGAVTAGSISGVTMSLANGNFVVDSTGKVTVNASGTFNGNLDVQITNSDSTVDHTVIGGGLSQKHYDSTGLLSNGITAGGYYLEIDSYGSDGSVGTYMHIESSEIAIKNGNFYIQIMADASNNYLHFTNSLRADGDIILYDDGTGTPIGFTVNYNPTQPSNPYAKFTVGTDGWANIFSNSSYGTWIQGSLNVEGSIQEKVSWTTAILVNSWTQYASGAYYAGYMKDANGFVHIRGSVKGTTSNNNTIAFTLPTGCRPENTLYYTTCVGTGTSQFGYIKIDSAGTVVINASTAGTFVSLDNVTPFLGF